MPRPEKEPLERVLERLDSLYAEDEDFASLKQVGATTSQEATSANAAIKNGTYKDQRSATMAERSKTKRVRPDVSMLPLLAAICMITRNEPSDFGRLFNYYASSSSSSERHNDQDDNEQLDDAALAKFILRLRTALFKAVPLIGVPRIINAQAALYEAVSQFQPPRGKERLLPLLPAESTKPTHTTEEDSRAGWAFFKAIYERHAESIIDRIGKTSPDLAEMIVDELYGANLSRTEVLSWQETVLIEFVGW